MYEDILTVADICGGSTRECAILKDFAKALRAEMAKVAVYEGTATLTVEEIMLPTYTGSKHEITINALNFREAKIAALSKTLVRVKQQLEQIVNGAIPESFYRNTVINLIALLDQ